LCQRIEDVRKENENDVIELSTTTDGVYDSVREKVDTDVTQAREAVAQIRACVDDKFGTVSGDMQQVRRNADEILNVNAILGELQHKLASGISNNPQPADSGDASVMVNTTDQQVASASSLNNNTL
jgi:hypothetical protein